MPFLIQSTLVQVYLVTGGQHHTQNSGNLDTTELLSQGATSWVTSGALPGPRKGLKAARLNEKLILSGGSCVNLG